MPYRTITPSWTVYLIHRLLLGKFLKYLLIIQACELICQTSSDAAVFEMYHNDFFAKTFHSCVEFYFCGGDREVKQGCKNSYYKVINALMFADVFDRIYSYYRQTSAQRVFICKDDGRCGEGNNRRSSCMMKCLTIILRFCEWLAQHRYRFISVFQSDAKTKYEKRNSNPFFKVMRKRKTKTEIQIPFSKCGENEKRNSNPFFNVTSRQKTKNRNGNGIPFYKAEEKRKIKMKFEFHFFMPSKNGWH